ncbi:hypothetical protein [Nonomuraea diastatica]|uniref:Tyr recombinase domain-containing protein n=1 Tax=Nonomuraea diastatica TaxID=1848329 RepID=A0A4R4WB40_9ACTN|nr:hypothetical protein [Nonomuraea diastatica]TDD16002.1 hypothetical protein E1294_32845 [Nonomuraea diastatica]
MLHTFFDIMLFAGLRPSEVMALTVDGCHLPLRGWGKLTLTGAAPDVGTLWTDTGERHEKEGLKHRATTAMRIMPIPPELVAILRAYLNDFPPAADGSRPHASDRHRGRHDEREDRSGPNRANDLP